jgi:RNA exonuclease 4
MTMADLSTNWKRLQATLKGESHANPPSKRKAAQLPNANSRSAAKKIKTAPTSTKKSKETPESDSRATLSTLEKTMGAVQSFKIEDGPHYGPSPSLALWAEDNDISAESLAEAYHLGVKNNSMLLASADDRINYGLTEGISIGKYVAIDCEMVGVGPGGHESSLARVSIVDFHGRQIYDSYVKQKERVTNWRTEYSGISPKEMRSAREFGEVQKVIHDVIKDKILIGHDIKHDLEVLRLSHPIRDIRDTSRHAPFKKHGNSRKPALRNLARDLLAVDIQDGAHSSIEDARVTMLLFRKHKSSFDVDHANRYPSSSGGSSINKPLKGKKKKKKKKKG